MHRIVPSLHCDIDDVHTVAFGIRALGGNFGACVMRARGLSHAVSSIAYNGSGYDTEAQCRPFTHPFRHVVYHETLPVS